MGSRNKVLVSLAWAVVLSQVISIVHSITTEEDLTLTKKEKDALDKFIPRVSPILPHEYQKQPIYLIRWLRARNLDLNQAERMLRDNLKWRQDNKMDKVLEEDFTELDRDYPYQTKFFDKEGKPIVTANFQDWDIRKLAVSGRMPALMRHLDRAFENVTKQVRDLQSEGKPISLFDFIINMDGFNLITHGCLQCLPFYLHLVNTYENHYPGSADKIMLINTPTIFELVLNLIRPAMSPVTRQALKVYNNNKQVWQNDLLKIVDRDQLPVEYGGTKEV